MLSYERYNIWIEIKIFFQWLLQSNGFISTQLNWKIWKATLSIVILLKEVAVIKLKSSLIIYLTIPFILFSCGLGCCTHYQQCTDSLIYFWHWILKGFKITIKSYSVTKKKKKKETTTAYWKYLCWFFFRWKNITTSFTNEWTSCCSNTQNFDEKLWPSCYHL